MAAYGIGQAIIFSSCGFFFLLLLFLSPILSGRKLDVYDTSTHDVALVRIWNAGLKSAARGSLKKYRTQKSPKIAIWAPSHNILSGCTSSLRRHASTIGKKLVKRQYLLHMSSQNMANFGQLTAETGSEVWGTPANFNGFRVLPSLLQRRRSPEAN